MAEWDQLHVICRPGVADWLGHGLFTNTGIRNDERPVFKKEEEIFKTGQVDVPELWIYFWAQPGHNTELFGWYLGQQVGSQQVLAFCPSTSNLYHPPTHGWYVPPYCGVVEPTFKISYIGKLETRMVLCPPSQDGLQFFRYRPDPTRDIFEPRQTDLYAPHGAIIEGRYWLVSDDQEVFKVHASDPESLGYLILKKSKCLQTVTHLLANGLARSILPKESLYFSSQGHLDRVVEVAKGEGPSWEKMITIPTGLPTQVVIDGDDEVVIDSQGDEQDATIGEILVTEVPGLLQQGKLRFVDGLDEIWKHGNSLIGEKVTVQDESNRISATIIGMWPCNHLPLDLQPPDSAPAEAVFFLQGKDRYQRSTIGVRDALKAVCDYRGVITNNRLRVLTVFSESCAMCLAFWLYGVKADAYDPNLHAGHTLTFDDAFLERLRNYDFVIFQTTHLGNLVDWVSILRAIDILDRHKIGFLLQCSRSGSSQQLQHTCFEFNMYAFGYRREVESLLCRFITNRPHMWYESLDSKCRHADSRFVRELPDVHFTGDFWSPPPFCEAVVEAVLAECKRM